jgi:hypothetical protein
MAIRYGADTSVLDWRERLVCTGESSHPGPITGRDLQKATCGKRLLAAAKSALQAAETLGSFTARYEISFGRLKL